MRGMRKSLWIFLAAALTIMAPLGPLSVPAAAAGASAQPEPAAQAEWYVSPGGNVAGPFQVAHLIEMAQKGELTPDTLCWKDGMAQWQRLADVPELRSVVAQIVAAPAAPSGPPPLPDAQTVLTQKTMSFLAATWKFEGDVDIGGLMAAAVIKTTFHSDGTWVSFETYKSLTIQAAPVVLSRKGEFRLTVADDTHFAVLFLPQGADAPAAETVLFRIIDQNTIENGNTRLKGTRSAD